MMSPIARAIVFFIIVQTVLALTARIVFAEIIDNREEIETGVVTYSDELIGVGLTLVALGLTVVYYRSQRRKWNPDQGNQMSREGLLDRLSSGEKTFHEFELEDGTDLSGIDLSGCDFTGSFLTDISFRDCNLRQATLHDCNLKCSDFSGADLTDASFQGAAIEGILLESAIVEPSALVGANYHSAILDLPAATEFLKREGKA